LLKASTSRGSKYGFFSPPSETSASTCSATLTGQPSSRTWGAFFAARSFALTFSIFR
jgi:hypothetical protein